MRCLALAQGWQDIGGEVVFVMAESTPAVESRLKAEGMGIERIDAEPGGVRDTTLVCALARERSAAWVVLDGYRFGADYQWSLKAESHRVLFVDDNGHAKYYSADLLLNQNVHACENIYQYRSNDTRLLLGPKYAMLRREFASWRNWKRTISATGRRLLISFGGSDSVNFTLRVLEALHDDTFDGVDSVVVVGGNNPHLQSLEQSAEKCADRIRLTRDASNMPELMAWADCAVAAAGATCWEMCFLGLPALLVDLAPNQFATARRLSELGVDLHLGGAQDVSSSVLLEELQRLLHSAERRARMSEAGRELVDGLGVSRVIRAMDTGAC
jgi:UDP-2,4-diacetamido-2,4,6-trideoxy-beta-L-altropyranose hydrolase